MYNSAVRLLDHAANMFPQKTALYDEWGSITFSALQQKAKKVATALLRDKEDGINPVIVYLPKSISCIVSFMGVLYSANPYVPVASDMPVSRIAKIFENLKPKQVITDQAGKETLENAGLSANACIYLFEELENVQADEELVENSVHDVVDTDPIYILYTSGSTGTPKGVTVPHKGVIDYVQWTTKTFHITEQSVLGNQAPFYFDNSIFDIYGCLLSGATMWIIPESFWMFPIKLPEFLKEHDITTIFWVPTVMMNVANSGALEGISLPKLENVLFCGEVMPNAQLNVWRKALPNVTYANLYGPTEISDVCSYYIIDRPFLDHEPLPIGKACENMRILILNEKNELAKTGEQGEICVIGTGVALGYWNAPEITGKAFVQNPLHNRYYERMYRTGDLGYVGEEGLIMYIGRMDSQIKLKGNRIELGEIENAAQCIDGVENACALFDSAGQKIVLFLETKQTFLLRKLNMELKQYIPKYMLPGELVTMEKFPHTANDKIDRVTLRKQYIEGGN